ncbi:MAG: hypothetical protein LPK19_11465, partial [Hymenobacteraceae bacterium]|nr:hypothetical protein [Hymenobacteraceae bacterium]MDX5396844.1 hypothetical protein [Hymenobacteraceae bacterium]MDX5512915.1 hypothetical protein [Hymenobacteraceae bacterium]
MLAAGFSSYAQPNVAKDGGTSGSTFALGSTSARKTQLLYLPSDLTGAFSGNVGKIFFRYNTTTGNTLTDFTVKMGQTSNTGFSP